MPALTVIVGVVVVMMIMVVIMVMIVGFEEGRLDLEWLREDRYGHL